MPPRLTPDEFNAITQRIAGAKARATKADTPQDSGSGQHRELQKLKNNVRPKGKKADADNRPAKKEADGSDQPQYRLSVTFRVSDKRHRDGDGMLATIFDATTDAVGRLTALDTLDKGGV